MSSVSFSVYKWTSFLSKMQAGNDDMHRQEYCKERNLFTDVKDELLCFVMVRHALACLWSKPHEFLLQGFFRFGAERGKQTFHLLSALFRVGEISKARRLRSRRREQKKESYAFISISISFIHSLVRLSVCLTHSPCCVNCIVCIFFAVIPLQPRQNPLSYSIISVIIMLPYNWYDIVRT